VRRRGRQLLTTQRGRALLDAPDQLAQALRADMASGDQFTAALWPRVRATLAAGGEHGVDAGDLVFELLAFADAHGWRLDTGEPIDEHALWQDLQPLRCRGEAYGLIATVRAPGTRWRLRLTDSACPDAR